MLLTKRHYLMMGGSVVAAAALTLAATTLPNRSEPVTLAENTAIHVTLDQAVSSNRSNPGDHFEATVSEPVVIDGKTVIPQGTQAEGLVVDAHKSGRLIGRARLQLALQSVAVEGQDYDVRTLSHARIGRNHKKRNWLWIGGGAGGGGAIGALAGGGTRAVICRARCAGRRATRCFAAVHKHIQLAP